MKNTWMFRFSRVALFLLCFVLPLQNSFALEQNEKVWLGFGIQKPFTADQKWRYSFYTTLRFIDKSHAWQSGFLEGGLGHVLSPGKTLWLGYRYSGINPYNDYFSVNMLWQQLIWDTRDVSNTRVLLRTRFEESQRGNRSQTSLRLRERFYLGSPQLYFGYINPVFYEEVFFQLNKTDYTTHRLVSENRVFIGFNFLRSTQHFWEIGYINQYIVAAQPGAQNQMDHVISFNYLII